MDIEVLIGVLERLAPPDLAEPFDVGKIGLSLDGRDNITKVAVSLDPSLYAVQQAVLANADILVTHHPLIFNPITTIPRNLSRILDIAISNHLALYSMHTNYDKANNGINDALATTLGLKDITKLDLGSIGRIKPTNAEEFAKFVGEKLDTYVKIFGDTIICIENVMVMGGSCFRNEYIDLAHRLNIDAFISGDLMHHVMKYAEDVGRDICLIDATHYATEIPGMKSLRDRINSVVETILIEDKPSEKSIYLNKNHEKRF
jgi:dinuclear metal center YbgI/SA1388 family protein